MTDAITVAASPRRPRGRPTPAAANARELDLLSVAAELFGRDGFAGTSVNEIARLSGISKTTIYARYRNKTDLFRAICSAACRLPSDAFRAVDSAGRDPSSVLHDFAAAARAGMSSDAAKDFLRLAIFEATRFPDLAHAILEESRQIYAPLAAYLAALVADDVIDGEPNLLADQFITLVTGGYHGLLNSTPATEEEDHRITSSLALFLSGVGLIAGA